MDTSAAPFPITGEVIKTVIIEKASAFAEINLGKQGEGDARKVVFADLRKWQEVYGDGGSISLIVKRSEDEDFYPVVLIDEGDGLVSWVVSRADTAFAGEGVAQLRYILGDTIAKSTDYKTRVVEAGGSNAYPPAEYQSWVDEVLAAAATAEGAVDKLPYVGTNGHWWRWDGASGGFVDTGVSASGEQGEPGEPGKDGADGAPGADGKDGETPEIGANGNWFIGGVDTGKPSRGADGADGAPGADGKDGAPGKDGKDAITPNMVEGTLVEIPSGSGGSGGTAAEVEMRVNEGYIQYTSDGGETWENLIAQEELEGADGAPGADGSPGADGYSPSAKVEQTDTGATITITDKDGTTTASVSNGRDGEKGDKGDTGAAGADGAPGAKGDKGDKGDTGATGAQGEKGEKGDPGEDYTLTEDDKQEIATLAAALVPSSGGGENESWELINTVNVTEAVEAITISEDTSSASFQLRKIAIYAPKSITCDSGSQLFVDLTQADSAEMRFSSMNNAIKESESSLWVEFEPFGQYWREILCATTYGDLLVAMDTNIGIRIARSSGQPVTKIRLRTYSEITGGTFYIYGVRA